MRCDDASTQLKTYLDGELHGLVALRVRDHLRRCPECAAQLAEWRKMSALLLSNDLVAMPALPIPAARTVSKGRITMHLKLLAGVTATAAATLALLLLPGRGRHNMSMASEIRQAVSQINTWHLKGWKMQGKDKIPWEVWGRRAPFFYREQVGQDVIVDDGTQRVSIFAPLNVHLGAEAPYTSSSLVLRAPSFPDAQNARWSYQRILAPWNYSRIPWAQTAEEATFNDYHRMGFGGGDNENADVLTTVSKQTWLPTRFESRRSRIGGMQTMSLLNADYNAPTTALALVPPSAPKDYFTYDATQPPPQVEYAATANGITVQAIPLTLAPDGTILLRIKTWMGSAPMRRSGPMHYTVTPQNWFEPRTPATIDDQGRAYTNVVWNDVIFGSTDDTSFLILLTPADPFAPGSPAPSELTLRLDFNGYLDTRLMGSLFSPDDGEVMLHKITLKLPLPAPSAPIEQTLPAYVDSRWKQQNAAYGFENLPAATDLARARFHAANQGVNASRPHLKRAVDYFEKYIASTSLSAPVNVDRYNTAQLCARLGDKIHARHLLQAIIDDKHPVIPMVPHQNAVRRGEDLAFNRRIHERECKGAQAALDTWAR